jgi:hypothetical protein
MSEKMEHGQREAGAPLKVGRREGSTSSKRAEQLRRSADRIVDLQTRELLAANPAWSEIASELKRIKHDLHMARLRTTKSNLSYESFSAKIQTAYENLQEAHAQEAFALLEMIDARVAEETLKERTAAQVRRELRFPEAVPNLPGQRPPDQVVPR